MATHVASNTVNPTRGGDNHSAPQELSGTSYAHAVLNFKSNDNSNKENINEDVKDVQFRTNRSAAQQTNIKNLKEPVESYVDDAGSFTPVVNHSRKERKIEKNKREKLKETNSAKPLHNGTTEKREISAVTKEPPCSVQEKDTQELKKVFVEAPLPKVNPWQANKNAAQLLAAKDIQTEKRILQPQKQDTSINGQPSSSHVRAPKDRRKSNQRVSFKCYPVLTRSFSFITESNKLNYKKLEVMRYGINYSVT